MGGQILCMGCMNPRDLGAKEPCQLCGFEETAYLRQPLVKEGVYLLPGSCLMDRQYILGRVLGHGAFGITYLARDENSHSRVAIKEYMPRNLVQRSPDSCRVLAYSDSDQELFNRGLECFLEEARKRSEMGSLPGLVGVKDYFFENGTGYLVMDYLEGTSLEQYLEMLGRRFEWAEAMLFFKPVLDTLHGMHKAGIIHGDVCLENVFVCDDGEIRLLGSGAVHLAYRDNLPGLTVVFKPGYTPLEQYSRKGGYGPYTDIYAAAATLFRMLTGRVVPEASARLEKDSVPSLLEEQGWPSRACEAMKRALALYPEQRYGSIPEFAFALEEKEAGDVPGGLLLEDTPGASIEAGPMPWESGHGPGAVSRDRAEAPAANASADLEQSDSNDILPSGYEAVMKNVKNANVEERPSSSVVVYRRRKIVLLLIVVLVALLGLGAGSMFYNRYPGEVSAAMETLNGIILQLKFW